MSGRHRFCRPERLICAGYRLVASTGGATAIEYALLAGLIALVIVGALGAVGESLRALPLQLLVNAFASVLS